MATNQSIEVALGTQIVAAHDRLQNLILEHRRLRLTAGHSGRALTTRVYMECTLLDMEMRWPHREAKLSNSLT